MTEMPEQHFVNNFVNPPPPISMSPLKMFDFDFCSTTVRVEHDEGALQVPRCVRIVRVENLLEIVTKHSPGGASVARKLQLSRGGRLCPGERDPPSAGPEGEPRQPVPPSIQEDQHRRHQSRLPPVLAGLLRTRPEDILARHQRALLQPDITWYRRM